VRRIFLDSRDVRALVRRSPTLKHAAKSAQSAFDHWRRFAWKARRRSSIRSYLDAYQTRKLQIGCGELPMPGWLNTDLDPGIGRAAGTEVPVIYMDASAPFPIPDDAFDFIYAEHVIEHVPLADGQTMLSESHRVLRRGGRIRVATPDLRQLVQLYVDREEPSVDQSEYISWIAETFFADPAQVGATVVLNNAFRAWGHAFLYDEETLRSILLDAGFVDVRRMPFGESDNPNLRSLERHGDVVGSRAMNEFETMVLEASKQ
jgi:predicted SAM-dependent methyltransferase